MTYPELILAVMKDTKLQQENAVAAVSSVFDVIKRTLARGDMVRIDRFGTFLLRETGKRTNRNSQTGEEITMPESVIPAFRADKELMDIVSQHGK